MLKSFLLILQTEFVLLLRQAQTWLYSLMFFLIIVSLYPLSITPDIVILKKIMPGCLWIAALLASLLAMENIFFVDVEDGQLEQFLFSHVPLSLIVFAKILVQWFFLIVPLIVLTFLFGISIHMEAVDIFVLCLSLLCGTPLLICMGTFGAALTIGLHRSGMLLGLLILPLVTPTLIFGVASVTQIHAGITPIGPLVFLAGLSVLGFSTFPWVIASVLRISLED